MIPADLHYLFPSAIYLLFFAIPIVWIGFKLFYFRRESLKKIASKDVLRAILIPRSRLNYWGKLVALVIIWISALLAIMQPVGNGHYPLEKEEEVFVKRKAHDFILLVDASASMELKDTRTGVTRFEYAKEIGDEIISQLRGESVALYGFTSGTTKVSPITLDYLFIRIMLGQMRINEGDISGTDFKKALEEIQQRYFSTLEPKQRTLVIISDGGDIQAETLSGSAREERVREILTPLSDSERMHLRVFSIGVGSREGAQIPDVFDKGKPVISKLDENLLTQLSQKGRGKYYYGNGMTAVAISEDLIDQLGKDKLYLQDYGMSPMKGKEDLVYDLFFQYPLALALILTAFLIFFPDTRTKRKSFFLLLIPFQIHGDIGREAQGYYEAGAYEKAIEQYQELKKGSLLNWQQAAVEYNRAASMLMKGNWEDGVEVLLTIQTSSPSLREKIGNSLATARYWQAQKIFKGTSLNDESYRKGVFLLREALLTCKDSELRKAIKRELAITLGAHLDFLIEKSEPKVALPILLSGVRLILSDLQFIENRRVKGEYLDWIATETQDWVRLWDAQTKKVPELMHAEEKFKKGIAFLEKGVLEKSRRSLQSAASSLLGLIRQISSDDPVVENLQNLLLTYYRTLSQTPLQEAALYRLQLEQNQLDLNDPLFDKAVSAIQEGKNFEARLYLEGARQKVRRTMRRLTSKNDPTATLEEAIEDQQYALSVERLLQMSQDPTEEMILLVESAQKQTIQTAEPFWDQVLEEQIREFPKRCQCKPWNDVLPLYEKGLRAARVPNKEDALNYWREALDRLLGKEKKADEPTQEEGKSMKSVIQELQQMEQDDRRPQAVEKINIKGERSW